MSAFISSPYVLAAVSLVGVLVGASFAALVILIWDEVQYRKLDRLIREEAARRAQRTIDSWKQ